MSDKCVCDMCEKLEDYPCDLEVSYMLPLGWAEVMEEMGEQEFGSGEDAFTTNFTETKATLCPSCLKDILAKINE